MALTRFNYDDARTIKKIQESTDVGRWILGTPDVGHLKYFDDPHMRQQMWGGNLSSRAIEAEDELRGLSRKQTKYCDINKSAYFPIERCGTYLDPITEQTRATNPVWWYRSLETTRWEMPIKDDEPLRPIVADRRNDEYINTRNVLRDAFNRR